MRHRSAQLRRCAALRRVAVRTKCGWASRSVLVQRRAAMSHTCRKQTHTTVVSAAPGVRRTRDGGVCLFAQVWDSAAARFVCLCRRPTGRARPGHSTPRRSRTGPMVRVRVRVRVRVCVRVCVRACVRARVCVRAIVRVRARALSDRSSETDTMYLPDACHATPRTQLSCPPCKQPCGMGRHTAVADAAAQSPDSERRNTSQHVATRRNMSERVALRCNPVWCAGT
jgi:hypothetical protein